MIKEEQTQIKAKRLSDKIRKKEKYIEIQEKTSQMMRKAKIKLEAKLKQAIRGEKGKEDLIKEIQKTSKSRR